MEKNQIESEFEYQRLAETISLAKSQLEKARLDNEDNMDAIIEAKRELREDTPHSVSGLWSSDGFEDLVALSQYVNPIMYQIAEYEATEDRIAMLEKIVLAPYFARIDFQFDDEDVPEKVYIGRTSLIEDSTFDMYVYDWRSPIASMFYRFTTGPAFYDAPSGKIEGQLSLKRQYEIKNGSLEYFFDADVQIIDDFLRKLLSQNTSSQMKSIVETIQKEQDIVIRDMENDLMMVQGVAGSGKTSIALHRAAYLMYQGLTSKLAAHNIIIISPNTLFAQYISNVLPELGEDNVVSVVFEEILETILQSKHIQTRNQFLETIIANSLYRERIKSSMEFKTSGVFLEILNRFIEDIPVRWIQYADVRLGGQCIVSKDALMQKIAAKNPDTPLGLKLEQLEEYYMETASELLERRLDRPEAAMLRKELQNFTVLSVETLYRKLFEKKEYIRKLADGLTLPENVEDIIVLTQENLSSDTIYYDDAAAMAFLTMRLRGAEAYRNIKQVVIDEAQDYYPLHFEIFRQLFSGAKYTVLGDINQTLEKKEDVTLYEQIGKILNKKKSTLVTMDKSFRCTNEILRFSQKFLACSTEIKSFNRSGEEPTVLVAEDQPSLCGKILSEIQICLAEGYRSIGLICKTEKNARALFKLLKDKVDTKLIQNESTESLQGILIIPVYMSKGLEFDAVLICDADKENYRSEDDRKLLYIACTRALHRLNLFCEGEVSRHLT